MGKIQSQTCVRLVRETGRHRERDDFRLCGEPATRYLVVTGGIASFKVPMCDPHAVAASYAFDGRNLAIEIIPIRKEKAE